MPDPQHTPSYGAIVIEQTDNGPLVLMCGGEHHMSFPKGHQEPGETPEQTARREVLEETCIEIEVDTSFSRTVDSFLPGDERTVTFFLGTSLEGLKEPVLQESELDRVAWVPLEKAPALFAYEPDRHVFEEALAHLHLSADSKDGADNTAMR